MVIRTIAARKTLLAIIALLWVREVLSLSFNVGKQRAGALRNGSSTAKGSPAKRARTIEARSLDAVVARRPFVVALFCQGTHEDDSKAFAVLRKLASSVKVKGIEFLRVKGSDAQEPLRSSSRGSNEPAVYLYVRGHRRHFNGQLTFADLALWIRGAHRAKPIKIAKASDIERADKHYLVYANLEWIMRNQQRTLVLAKLLSPLGIYTTANGRLEQRLHGGGQEKPPLVWVKRKYDARAVEVDPEDTIERQVRFILDQEMPDSLECSEHSLELIQETRIPVLAYFLAADSDSESWERIYQLARGLKEYLLPMRVRAEDASQCAMFLRNYLEVEKLPALRILSIGDRVKRFEYVGDFDPVSLQFFLHNYINGNLQPYSINEKLKRGEAWNGLPKANTRLFHRLKKGSNHDHLLYVHSGSAQGDAQSNTLELLALQKELREEGHMKVYAFDHDKNDLERSFNHLHLPFVFFVTRTGKMLRYGRKISKAKLLEFIRQHFKHPARDSELSDEL